MIKIKYNQPIEVSKIQYNTIMVDFKGVCAGLVKDGKYFIKVWFMQYKKDIQEIIK